MSQKRLALVPILIIFMLIVVPQAVFCASLGPSWGTYEYGEFAKSLIVPRNSLVQQKLRSIAPVQDAAHFAQNLLKVYEFTSQLAGPRDERGPDADYFRRNWMDASEILQVGRGDCKNHAILLITLVEALYGNTFGNVPRDLVWIVGGCVFEKKPDNGHVWVLLNVDRIQSVSQDAFNLIRDTPLTTGTTTIPVGARPPWSDAIKWITFNLDSLADRIRSLFRLSIIQDGHFYVELEPYWKMSISEYYHKIHPDVELHDQWNSYEYRRNPEATPPGTGSVWVSSTTWRYGDTVAWSAEGLTPNGVVSVMIQGSWGSVQFPDVTANSRGEAGFSFVVGTNIQGSGRLMVIDRVTNSFLMKDYTLAQEAARTTTTHPVTYRFFSLPEECRGQQPSSNAHRDLRKVIMIEGVGSYSTPFSVQLTPGRTYTLTCSGAVSWDYYGIGGWKSGQTVQYTLDQKFNEVAAFFASTVGIKKGSPQIVDAYWIVGGVRVTQAKVGQTVQAHILVKAAGGPIEGDLTIRVKKDMVLLDTVFIYGSTHVSLKEGESVGLFLSFTADQKSDLLFRGFFIHVDFTSWENSWTMPSSYPPRLKVV